METKTENIQRWIGGIIALLFLLILFYLAAWRSTAANTKFASEVVALSVIGAIAVGIERIIEAFWAFCWEWTGHARNPLGPLSSEYRRAVADLDKQLQPFMGGLTETIEKVGSARAWTKAQAGSAKAELETVRNTLAELIPDIHDPKFEVLAAEALKQITRLQIKYPDLEQKALTAGKAIDGAVNFVESFTENPGRRLLSIYFGATLGLVLVWATGLDLFQASLGKDISCANLAGAHLGVALTGLILGLGSSPTHEVIQILKEIKISRKTANQLEK